MTLLFALIWCCSLSSFVFCESDSQISEIEIRAVTDADGLEPEQNASELILTNFITQSDATIEDAALSGTIQSLNADGEEGLRKYNATDIEDSIKLFKRASKNKNQKSATKKAGKKNQTKAKPHKNFGKKKPRKKFILGGLKIIANGVKVLLKAAPRVLKLGGVAVKTPAQLIRRLKIPKRYIKDQRLYEILVANLEIIRNSEDLGNLIGTILENGDKAEADEHTIEELIDIAIKGAEEAKQRRKRHVQRDVFNTNFSGKYNHNEDTSEDSFMPDSTLQVNSGTTRLKRNTSRILQLEKHNGADLKLFKRASKNRRKPTKKKPVKKLRKRVKPHKHFGRKKPSKKFWGSVLRVLEQGVKVAPKVIKVGGAIIKTTQQLIQKLHIPKNYANNKSLISVLKQNFQKIAHNEQLGKTIGTILQDGAQEGVEYNLLQDLIGLAIESAAGSTSSTDSERRKRQAHDVVDVNQLVEHSNEDTADEDLSMPHSTTEVERYTDLQKRNARYILQQEEHDVGESSTGDDNTSGDSDHEGNAGDELEQRKKRQGLDPTVIYYNIKDTTEDPLEQDSIRETENDITGWKGSAVDVNCDLSAVTVPAQSHEGYNGNRRLPKKGKIPRLPLSPPVHWKPKDEVV